MTNQENNKIRRALTADNTQEPGFPDYGEFRGLKILKESIVSFFEPYLSSFEDKKGLESGSLKVGDLFDLKQDEMESFLDISRPPHSFSLYPRPTVAELFEKLR